MPSDDRFWYLDLLPVGIIIVLPILLVEIAGNNMGSLADWSDPSNRVVIVVVAIAALLLPILARIVGVRGTRKLARLRRRRRAVLGEAETLPVSLVIPEVGSATQTPEGAGGPLGVWWQATTYTRTAAGLMAVQALIAVAADVMLIIVAALIIYAVFSAQYSARVRAVPAVVLALVIAAPFVMTPLLILLARMLPTQFGRHFGVVADDDGLTGAAQYGGHRRLRWDELRLLEVSVEKRGLGKRPTGYAYTVYGARSQIEWRDSYAGELNRDYEPVGMTTVEAQFNARRLLALAIARTGLPLRTLEPALLAPIAPR